LSPLLGQETPRDGLIQSVVPVSLPTGVTEPRPYLRFALLAATTTIYSQVVRPPAMTTRQQPTGSCPVQFLTSASGTHGRTYIGKTNGLNRKDSVGAIANVDGDSGNLSLNRQDENRRHRLRPGRRVEEPFVQGLKDAGTFEPDRELQQGHERRNTRLTQAFCPSGGTRRAS